MRRALLAVLVVLLLVSIVTAGGLWDVVPKVEPSVVRLVGFHGEDESVSTCAAFSIHQATGYLLTAAHCLAPELSIHAPNGGKYVASVVWGSEALDLLVLQSGWHGKALRPRAPDMVRGLEAGALGHAYGLSTRYFAAGFVAYLGALPEWEENGMNWRDGWLLISAPFIVGMSGGPIFDREGRVMGMVQRTSDRTGFGRPISVVWGATQAYWEKLR